jgi:hypothetical protein
MWNLSMWFVKLCLKWQFLNAGLDYTMQGVKHQVQCGEGAAIPHSNSWSVCKSFLFSQYFTSFFPFLSVHRFMQVLVMLSMGVLSLFKPHWAVNYVPPGCREDNPSLFGWAQWGPRCRCPFFRKPSSSDHW